MSGTSSGQLTASGRATPFGERGRRGAASFGLRRRPHFAFFGRLVRLPLRLLASWRPFLRGGLGARRGRLGARRSFGAGGRGRGRGGPLGGTRTDLLLPPRALGCLRIGRVALAGLGGSVALAGL